MCVFRLFVIDMCWRPFPITFYFRSICQIFISTRVFSFSTLGRGLVYSSLGLYPRGLFYFYPGYCLLNRFLVTLSLFLRLWDASEPFYGDSLIYYNFGQVFVLFPTSYSFCSVLVIYRLLSAILPVNKYF